MQVVSALLFLGYARVGLVASSPAPRPAPPAVPQTWGPPAAALAGPVRPGAPVFIPTARTSGRHAVDEDPMTGPIARMPAMR